MTATLEELVLKLSADYADMRKELRAASREVSTQAKAMKASFDTVSGATTGLARGIKALVTGAAVRELYQLTTAALAYADSIGDQASALGLSTTALQEYRGAALNVGVATVQLEKGISTLQRRMIDALRGNEAAKRSFETIGVSMSALRESGGDVEKVLDLVSDGMNNTESQATRVAVANELLGRSGFKLLPILQKGSAAFQEMRAQISETGYVMREETIVAFGDTADKVDLLATALKVQLYEAFIQLGPAIATSLEWLVKFAAKAGEVVDFAKRTAFEFGGVADLSPVSDDDLKERLRVLQEMQKTRQGQGGLGAMFLPPDTKTEIARLEALLADSKLVGRERGSVSASLTRLRGNLDKEGRDPFSNQRLSSDQVRIQEELARRSQFAPDFVGPPRPTELQLQIDRLRQERASANTTLSGVQDTGSASKASKAGANEAKRNAEKIKQIENDLVKTTLEASGQKLAIIFHENSVRLEEIRKIARSEEEFQRLRQQLEAQTGEQVAEELEKQGRDRKKAIDTFVDLEREYRTRAAAARGDDKGVAAIRLEEEMSKIDKMSDLSDAEKAQLKSQAAAVSELESNAKDSFAGIKELGIRTFGEIASSWVEGSKISFGEMAKSFASTLVRMEAEALATDLFGAMSGSKTEAGKAGGSIIGSLLGGLVGAVLPSHAEGGVTTKDHVALVHANEAIIPLDRFRGNNLPPIVIEHNAPGVEVKPQRVKGPHGRDQWRILVAQGVRDEVQRGGLRDVMGTRHSTGVS